MRLDEAYAVDDLDPDAWDALALTRTFYASHRWLRYQELDPRLRARYLVVRDDADRIVGGVPTYLVDRELSGNYRIPELFPDVPCPSGPTLLVGNHRGYHNRPVVSDVLTAEQRAQALRLLASAVSRLADAGSGGRAWWLYVDDRDVRELLDVGGTATPRVLHADCTVALPGRGFDDYLATLPSARRVNIRRDLRAFSESGLRLRTMRLSECWAEAGRLSACNMRRYGHRVGDELMAELLRGQCEATDDSGTVHACLADDVMVGFCLTFTFGGVVYVRTLGFDYDRLRDAREYFQLAYYAPIRDAYRSGADTLHLGMKSYHAKVLRGARVTPLWAVAVHPGAWSEQTARAHNRRRLAEIRSELGPHTGALDTGTWQSFA
jgi:hypothetical protein